MLSVLLFLVQSAGDPQPTYDGHLRQLDVHLPRIETTIRLDGVLDEDVWRRAAVLKSFSQYRPVDSRPADDSTEVRVFYAPDAIYFGIRAYEAHGDVVRATLADRDNIAADDNVQILLDTFYDRRRALLFAVNPLGAQQDGVRSEGIAGAAGGQNAGSGRFDGVVDLNPDYVYQSQGRVTATGYDIEVRIPFKSLRYQSGATQDWGIQVIRVTQHSGYEDTWTPVVRASASFLVQSGTLKALTGLRRGLVMDVSPEFTSRLEGEPESTSSYRYHKIDPALGVNVRWGITQSLSATGTINPDFSQVEADVGQVTVNERFALFFPEKRPFFLEGLEQFDTPNTLIYTRRINAPIGGAKLTGKLGRTAVAYIGAVDDDALSATGDHPIFNLVRLRRDLGANSTLGLAYTDRIEGNASNRVLGADARLIWKKLWFSSAQVVGSWTRDAAGTGTRSGTLWDVTLYDLTGRSYGNHGEIVGISPDFAALSGFVNRVNVVHARIFNRFTFYGKPGALLENATTFIGIQPTWRYDDFLHFRSTLEGSFWNQWILTLRGGWGLNARWSNDHQRFDPPEYADYQVDSAGTPVSFVIPHGLFNLWSATGAFNTPSRAVVLNLSVGAAGSPLFDEAARGRAFNLFAGLTWKPTSSLRFEGQWVHQRFTRSQDGSWFSTANIPRLKIEYQVSRAMFFRYVGQYAAQEVDALRDPLTGNPLIVDSVPQPRSTSTDFRNDFLFSYRPIPGTVVFLGYGTSLSEADPFSFRRLSRTRDGFFLKVSYLFRL